MEITMITTITDRVKANAERDVAALAGIEPLISALRENIDVTVSVSSDDHSFRVYLFPVQDISKHDATTRLAEHFPEWEIRTPVADDCGWGQVSTSRGDLQIDMILYARA